MNKKFMKTIATVLAGASVLSGCSNGAKKSEGPTTITWYVPTLLSGNGKDAVFEKVNDILTERYNLKLDMIAIDSGNYDQKMQVMNAAGEAYDLAYTAHWKNNYYSNVSNGVFREITEEELKEYAPETYKLTGEAAWNATRVGGKIYAVPNWQMQTRATAVFAPKEYLDLTGTNIDDLKSYDDITAYLKKLHAVKPEVNEVGKAWSQVITHHNMVEVYEETMPGVIDFTKEGKPVVFNQYESKEFADYVETRNMWIKEGLVTGQYIPDSKAQQKEFKTASVWFHQYSPMAEATATAGNEYDIKAASFSDVIMTPTGVTAALTGISTTSEHPLEALKLIEVMNTDSEVMNLIAYGIEGVDYDKVSDNQIKIREDKQYAGPALYILGSMGNAYLTDVQSPTLIEEMEEHNGNALASPLMGFNANLDDISLEISNCKTVVKEYLEMLDLGLYDSKKLAEFNSKLKAAGVDKIITELQRQIDEWWETK